ncbi:cache domain-containing protein [Geobacter argillaceus]|uniref:Single cache domain-containing protein n=1 Tax=Geobacter argillaceus TaxID=345631 RepID=A0A562WT23_9BACT|nr:cache domain-containing protein [Geobacter argillaceus]TWJ33451.1 single cache domain-containing protein [Geobacter argillaceus]
MKKLLSIVCLLAFGVLTTAVWGDERGSKDEAKVLVEKCVAYIKEQGKDKAFAEINNPKGGFVNKDLYIFAYDFQGEVLAHGANQKLIGKNLIDMKDPDGVFVIKGLIEQASKGEGWFKYKWTHPQTKKVEGKDAFVKKVDDTLWIGSGVYREVN